jgi:tellurite resistance protein
MGRDYRGATVPLLAVCRPCVNGGEARSTLANMSSLMAKHTPISGDHSAMALTLFVQSLAAAAATVAYADGRLHPAERREFGAYARQYLTRGAVRRWNVLALFDDRIRRLERGPHRRTEFLEELHFVAGTPRAPIILRAAERIAAADGDVSAAETETLTAIRYNLGIASDNRERFSACFLWGFPRAHR